ncbi:MAG: SGNH/GDSL hydrolase family protein [Cyanobacteriota bacterium]
MFKSHRRSYRKPRRSIPLPVIILAIPLALILLELLVRISVGVTGKSAELAAYEGQPANVTAYYLKFVGETQHPYDGLSDRGQLAAQRSLAGGYRLAGNQTSNFWRINEQGFRDDKPVPLEKPKDEIRIFLLGGSTAFGQWTASNQTTIASKLETRLNERIAQQQRSPEKYRPIVLPFYKPELEKALQLPPQIREGYYRVINAAVPGYASGNELAQLALQILPYSPDAVVVLDGYADLMLPSHKTQTDIPEIEGFLNNAPGHFGVYLVRQLQDAVGDMYLVKALQYWILRPQPSVSQMSLAVVDQTAPLDKYLVAEPAELERRVERYQNLHQQMVKLTTGASIPLVIAVQPEITGKETSMLSPSEQKILQELGVSYRQRVQSSYAGLVKAVQQLEAAFPKNVKTLNLYKLYESFPNRAFYDAVHLTEEGNVRLAERLYQVLTTLTKLQVTPPNKQGIED